MSLNASPSKSEAKLKWYKFCWKFNKPSNSSPALTEMLVQQATSQKHLATTLIKKLTYDEIIEQIKSKFNNYVLSLYKLRLEILRSVLLTMCKLFFRFNIGFKLTWQELMTSLLSVYVTLKTSYSSKYQGTVLSKFGQKSAMHIRLIW